MGRPRRREPADFGTLERARQIAETDQTLIAVQRVLDATGYDELARRMRHARAAVSDLLDRRD